MLEKGKISARQFMLLVFMYSLGTSIIVHPALTAGYAGTDAWITSIIAAVIGIGIVFLLVHVSALDTNKNLFELMEAILGKWMGKIVILLFLLFMLFLTATNLRQIGDFMITHIMLGTPISFIMLIFVLTSLYAIKLGLEVIGRSCEIFVPYAFISLMLLIILVSPDADLSRVKPILAEKPSATFVSALPTLGIPYLELVVFLAIIPYVNAFKKAKKGFYIGTIVASFLLFLITFMCLTVLGPEFTARQAYPTYILGKKISIANFLERIEILVAIAWFFTIFFKITVNFYVLSLGFSHFFKLKSPSTLSTPLSFILIILGFILYPNIVYYYELIAYYWVFFSATIGLCLPLLLLMVGKIRQRKT
ncbi:GerAB/ArcD/ProY family transporter [Oceanobacillus senegalensis]|uniref:GerAB/ArcD/ProY family transporter n=1 Tax=Oceanobacillus senegalensis TaxID=1936063 RepID=UPI000A30D823|nr:endospore germination permease [Oceanobacillus senegalensis]